MPTATKQAAQLDALLEKVSNIFEFQNNQLVERREALWVTLLGLFTPRFHVLLHGPPGVAKSMLFDGLARHAPDMLWFKTPAFKGSPPEQFLGPISLAAMTDEENERYERIVRGKFGWCEFCFVDELLRAPRAVLPVFQTGMSDGAMDNGSGLAPIPLRTFYAATNHLIESGDDDLAAFNDRFAAKLSIEPIQAQESAIHVMQGFLARRASNNVAAPLSDDLILSRDEIDLLTERSQQIVVPVEVLESVAQLRSNLLAAGMEPSIRRINQLLAAMQTDALLRGKDEVSEDQIQLGKVSLWTDPDEREPVEKEVLQFASEWDRAAAELLDDYDGSSDGSDFATRSEFLKLQSDFAQTGPNDVTSEMTNAGLKILRNHQILQPKIEKHIAEATGRDTHRLDAVLEEMNLARRWITDRLMGGLDMGGFDD
jgi:MoxR-like ATPase